MGKFQLIVATLICTNFATFIVSKQVDPNEEHQHVWEIIDLFL